MLQLETLSPDELLAEATRLQSENQSLTAEVKSTAHKLSIVQSELDLTVSINDELSAKITELEKHGPQKQTTAATKTQKTFTVDGKSYVIKIAQMRLHGTVVTADEILASDELQQKLVAMSSGAIEAV